MNKHSTKVWPALHSLAMGLSGILLAASVFGATSGAQAQDRVIPRERVEPDRLASWADAEFVGALADHRFSGLVMTVVKDGEIVFNRGYGQADPLRGTAVDPDATLFRIGSATKVFTATAIAQLLEQGRIASLDDPANKYLKRVQLPANEGRPITLWQLLTHRAGFEDSAYGLGADKAPDGGPAAAEEIAGMMPHLVRPAGAASVYSNFSTAILGVMIEDISGEPIKQFFAKHIFAPLGMARTRLSDDFSPDPALGVPTAMFPNGSLQALPYLPMRPFIAPAGGIITTGSDMARFMAAHIREGRGEAAPILKPETFALMHATKVSNHPAVSGFGMKFMTQRWNGEPVIEHGGGWPGFQTVMLMLPKSGVGVFISIMGADATAGLGESLASLVTQNRLSPKPGVSVKRLLNALVVREDILTHLLGAWQPDSPPAGPGVVDLQPYVGSYWRERRSYSSFEALFDLFSTRSAILRVERDGAEALRINGVGAYRQIAPDVFWNASARPQLDADPNAQALYAFNRAGGGISAVTPLLSVDQWTRTSAWVNPATLAPVMLVIAIAGLSSFILPFWPAADRISRAARWLPLAQWLLLIAIPLVLLAGYGEAESIVYRLLPASPGRFIALVALANLGALVALATAAAAWRAWRTQGWGTGPRGVARRVHYSVLAVLALLLVACLAFFNLIGVHWP